MTTKTIDRLIVNRPFQEPTRFWTYDAPTKSFKLKEGRRPAGFVRSSGSGKLDDPGIFVPLDLPNRIRDRVRSWREAGYPRTTGITRRLLQHWKDPDQRQFPFFFCQLEAIETLIWLAESPPADKQGIAVPSDGGSFQRFCSKMATGSGKTTVMAMLIAWHVLNKASNNQDPRFSKNVLVVGPGLTVKERLRVLQPSQPDNYYDEFGVVPTGMRHLLNQSQVLIENWHALAPIDPSKGPRVVKKGPESDEAFCRRVLADLGSAKNILVINDEAHHAWRITSENVLSREDEEEATLWIGGLDRVHRARGILRCHDLTATPFVPKGKNSTDELLFDWIVSDFGLNDAIESGLVKTPRIVVREDVLPDARTLKPKLYHIYSDETVKDDLNRKGARPSEPLPTLASSAYHLLGTDWLAAKNAWEAAGMPTPPVLITVANTTQTAARVANAFRQNRILVPDLCDPNRLLHIDSKVLKEAEEQDEASTISDGANDEDDQAPRLTKLQQAELLRQQVDTVGKIGKPGEKMQNIISVAMLSEGWDARTVTHIMGLRAFTSQLLCEQVVGRGLRRAVYNDFDENGFLKAEYVNVFGVPFTFLPVEGQEGERPSPPSPSTRIEALPEKSQYLIKWPNVIRINHVFRRDIALDLAKVEPLALDALKNPTIAQLAPVVDGKPKVEQIAEIDLQKIAEQYRLQRVAFQVARDIFNQEAPSWKGDKAFLMSRIVDIAQAFIESDKIEVVPPLFAADPMRRRLLVALYMSDIVHHLWAALVPQNSEDYELIFDDRLPVRTTSDMNPWYTSKPAYPTKRSHLNYAVSDSGWESTTSYMLDEDDERVAAWAKNDHLAFEISYVYRGGIYAYRPDYLVRLKNGTMLVLEVKGEDSEKNKAKRVALDLWIKAVNADGRFGHWVWDVIFQPTDVVPVLHKHCEPVTA